MSTSASELNPSAQARVETLQVIVKEETPFLPKVAFTLITLASLGGATFTGLGLGLDWFGIVLRWLTLWSMALAGGFLTWRVGYLRFHETQVDQHRLDELNQSALARADQVARYTAPFVLAGAGGALVVPTLRAQPALQWALVVGSLLLGTLLLIGVRRTAVALVGTGLTGLLIVGWAFADVGGHWLMPIRALHLAAFTLWLGGALWNISVAMPVGRQHPNVDAVLAGANQLDRFRWVVRFALPTIIITGVIMASGYRGVPLEWWVSFPGVLIPLKVLAIIALVVVFITCPLFRHFSPVQGVCNIDDLDNPRGN
ncbi:MAG TPA: hypothetical protein PLC19_11785 [Marmoricola sp.]|nr:hypothetical protein [Marmoricola sp.]